MCRVAGLSETPGSWRSSSGKGEAGKETGGKRGTGRGAEIDLERQRGTYIERDPDREMGRKKQGNREPERDRQRDRNTRACGGNGHTRSETEGYTLRWGKRERERGERWGVGERQRERERWETECALSNHLYQTGVGQSQDHAVKTSWGRVSPIRMPPSHTPLRAAVRCKENQT